jgi:prolactin regulatory element-binding protein
MPFLREKSFIYSNGEPLQRVVRVSLHGTIMATGGTDGSIRLWKFPQLHKLFDLDAHGNEIDDLDFSPDSNLLVSIAKDGKAFLWNVNDGKRDRELTWTPSDGAKYMYKRCRFRKLTEDKTKIDLFILSNAVVAKNPSFLQLWDANAGTIIKSAPYKETLSALAVSDDGKFVAVGTMFSGSVDIFVAFSLRKALHVPGTHSMFVTGLEFLPTKLDGPAITSNTETAVVSISVDNRICIHSIPFRRKYIITKEREYCFVKSCKINKFVFNVSDTLPFWFVIILIVLCISGAFMLCSYLGI